MSWRYASLYDVDAFEELMSTYGLPGKAPTRCSDLVAELPLFNVSGGMQLEWACFQDLDAASRRAFDPVYVAASSRSRLPVLPSTSLVVESYHSDTPHGLLRRRSSLVEAMNNGIMTTYSDNEDREAEERLNMLKRRAAMGPSSQRPGRFPVSSHQLQPMQHLHQQVGVQQRRPTALLQEENRYPPRALVRSYAHQVRERRARSQPLYKLASELPTDETSDDEVSKASTARHLSRADRYSIESEAGRSSHDSGIRSSTHSNSSTATTSSSISLTPDDGVPDMMIAEALWDHPAVHVDELRFVLGDVITVLDSTSNADVWYGACGDKTGWFPASYVRIRKNDITRLNLQTGGSENDYPTRMRHQRRRVVEELMDTERDYVKLLDNLVKGFMEQCRRRREMFPEERVRKIFSNLEQIADLHRKLLRELELEFNQKNPESSRVASSFLRNACRLLKGMTKLSLEGFLLTPVQRICRYPLQLYELLKATPPSHPDKIQLEQAHRTMKAVAAHVNDAKRRIDAIQKIVLWQQNVHGFRGPDLIDNNHRLLISGEMYCRAIMKSTVQWSKTVNVYMFDQSIVLCKKDVLKKNALSFKERMSLQHTSAIDLPDGKDVLTGANLRHSFKLCGPAREYLFTTSDPATKSLWLDTYRQRPHPNPPNNLEKRLALVTLGLSL